MDETRESHLATILARGLIRVRQRAERAGNWKSSGDEPQPSAADAFPDDHSLADHSAAASEQGEKQ